MIDTTCEFCLEINDPKTSIFHSLYGELLTDRVLFENQHFICIPTIGQLIKGSLLILPKNHLFTLASMPADQVEAFKELLSKARMLFKHSILFEHGCIPKNGHNCGVYHAHAHIIPIPSTFEPNELLPNSIGSLDLGSCFEDLKGEGEYALYVDSNGRSYYLLPSANSTEIFTSQYFRRWLTTRLHVNKEFDWKKYINTQEVELIDIVRDSKSNKMFHTYNDSF